MSTKRKDAQGRVLKVGESQRSDGRYQYRYTDGYGVRRTVYAHTLTDLRKKEDDISFLQHMDIEYHNSSMTVDELMQRYMESRTGVALNTKFNYQFKYRVVSRLPIANMTIKAVKMSYAKQVIYELYKHGLSPSTVTGYLIFLHQVFQFAIDDGILYHNPFKFNIKDVIPKTLNSSQPMSTLPTKYQIALWLNFVKSRPQYQQNYDIFVVLLHTGLRVSELCGLIIHDIDFDTKMINVNKQLIRDPDGQYHVVPLKTSAGIRCLPMSTETYDALLSIISKVPSSFLQLKIDGYSGFILRSLVNKPKVSYQIQSHFTTSVKAFNDTYGFNPPIKITPHVLRHVYCSMLVEAGVSLKIIQYLMGHKHFSTSLNVYTSVNDEWVQQELKKIKSNNDIALSNLDTNFDTNIL